MSETTCKCEQNPWTWRVNGVSYRPEGALCGVFPKETGWHREWLAPLGPLDLFLPATAEPRHCPDCGARLSVENGEPVVTAWASADDLQEARDVARTLAWRLAYVSFLTSEARNQRAASYLRFDVQCADDAQRWVAGEGGTLPEWPEPEVKP